MSNYYYNLAGGINLASTKTELGLDTKKIYWSDSENVEIYLNKGIIRQKGNAQIFTTPDNEKVINIHEMKKGDDRKLVIITESGKIYIYNDESLTYVMIDKEVSGSQPFVLDFLNGVIVGSETDSPFYIKNDGTYTVESCNLKDSAENPIATNIITVYKGRIWAAKDSSLYYSALGTYNDFTTSEDAGYINDFHTNTDKITVLKQYKDYLAIYKEKAVYLLTGDNPSNFAIILFADKGAYSINGVINVNNKQYFLSQGIYALQAGELNQLYISDELTLDIKPEFTKFDMSKISHSIILHYEAKNQIWLFVPHQSNQYMNRIWIYDYVNKAWYKRVLPQNITTACIFNTKVYTADSEGNVYQEDIGSTFDGEPITFYWKSPFLCLGNPSIRKTIDEFYFLLDETYENNFKFSVFKNYDSENKDDMENIHSTNFQNLHWENINSSFNLNDTWDEGGNFALWAVSADSAYKAEISEANYSIQLCVEGFTQEHHVALIGLEFREIYNEH